MNVFFFLNFFLFRALFLHLCGCVCFVWNTFREKYLFLYCKKITKITCANRLHIYFFFYNYVMWFALLLSSYVLCFMFFVCGCVVWFWLHDVKSYIKVIALFCYLYFTYKKRSIILFDLIINRKSIIINKIGKKSL